MYSQFMMHDQKNIKLHVSQYDPEITESHTCGFFFWEFPQNDAYNFSLLSTMYLDMNHQAYTKKNDHYICHKLRQGTADGFDIVRSTRITHI